MIPLRFSLLVMSRTRCNKKNLTLKIMLKVNFCTNIFLHFHRFRSVESCYSSFYAYFLYSLYIKRVRIRDQVIVLPFFFVEESINYGIINKENGKCNKIDSSFSFSVQVQFKCIRKVHLHCF